MLTLTRTMLSGHALVLGSLLDKPGSKPVLVLINWLTNNHWQDSESLVKAKNHYKLVDSDITFIDQNSLSTKNAVGTLLLATICQLHQYQSGSRQRFELPIDTKSGTPFQQKVWQALQQIPYGQTISYALLAKNIEQPNAFRAVASANGKNCFSVVIPCHRVIASDGGLGGYTGGIDKKKMLLEIERQVI